MLLEPDVIERTLNRSYGVPRDASGATVLATPGCQHGLRADNRDQDLVLGRGVSGVCGGSVDRGDQISVVCHQIYGCPCAKRGAARIVAGPKERDNVAVPGVSLTFGRPRVRGEPRLGERRGPSPQSGAPLRRAIGIVAGAPNRLCVRRVPTVESVCFLRKVEPTCRRPLATRTMLAKETTGEPPSLLFVFDMDDTLVETFAVAYAKTRATARILGLEPPSESSFRASFGQLSFDECLQRWHGQVDRDGYLEIYDSLRDRFPYRPFAGAAPTIRNVILAGHDVAVLTNGPGNKTSLKLAAVGLEEALFRFVRHADNMSVLKPAAASFAAVHSDEAFDAASTIYISDRPHDGIGATEAGWGFIGITTGVWSRADFCRLGLPDQCVIDRIEDILNVTGWRRD